MPPRKRTTRSTAAAGRQNTLSFSASAKITKPGAAHKAKDLDSKPKAAAVVEAAQPVPDTSQGEEEHERTALDDNKPAQSPLAIRESKTAAAPSAQSLGEDETKALQVSDSQVKKYWEAKEEARIYPRVHQKGLNVHNKILREFDLSSQYGPCIGIPRTKRWKRAHRLGLNPPIEVLAVLLKEEKKQKQKGTAEVAYVDELMGSKDLAE